MSSSSAAARSALRLPRAWPRNTKSTSSITSPRSPIGSSRSTSSSCWGRATSREVLTRAGADKADVFVACTGLDEVNIVSCGIARLLAKPRTICFVSREDFLQSGDEAQGLAGFGIDRVVWPEAQLAKEIERIVRTPGALDAETFADGAIRLVEYRLEPDSPFIGRVADLHLPHELADRRCPARRRLLHSARREHARGARQGARDGHARGAHRRCGGGWSATPNRRGSG